MRYASWEGHRGLAKRSLFVVDPSGVIAYSWATDDALVLPDIDELIEAVVAVGSNRYPPAPHDETGNSRDRMHGSVDPSRFSWSLQNPIRLSPSRV